MRWPLRTLGLAEWFGGIVPWTLLALVLVIFAAALSGVPAVGTVLDDCTIYRGENYRAVALGEAECKAALERQLAEPKGYHRPEWARTVLHIAGLPESLFH